MNNDFTYAIGLMSGTSLDGIDVVYVRFDKKEYKNFKILKSVTYPYDKKWISVFKEVVNYNSERLDKLDIRYGQFIGNLVLKFINTHQIERVDFIASHGHTVFHQPNKGITKQIGDGKEIAKITSCKVVCDFRTQDVYLGGQGAPLVPIGDQLLFSQYDACLNLGGFANISYDEKGSRLAFDICPVNTVLNFYTQSQGFDYDDRGNFASKGTIDKNLLDELNQIDFYGQLPPKSLGIEWVNEIIFPKINAYQIKTNDILRTFVEHVAIQIATHLNRFEKVLFSGGGVYNTFLIKRIQELTSTKIVIPREEIIDFKEALVFAFLGLLKIEGKVNCLSSVTGARTNHSSGKIFNPN